MTYPKTMAELAVSTKPSPVELLRAAADLLAEANGYEFLEAMFATAADDADTDLAWSPAPDDRSLDYAWIHYGGSCGPIDECSCTLSAVIKAALELAAANTPAEPVQGTWTSGTGRTYDLSALYEDRYGTAWRCVAVNSVAVGNSVPYMHSKGAGGPLPWVIEMFGPLLKDERTSGGVR